MGVPSCVGVVILAKEGEETGVGEVAHGSVLGMAEGCYVGEGTVGAREGEVAIAGEAVGERFQSGAGGTAGAG